MIDPKVGEKTRFSKTNQPANRGSKPSSLKKYFKANNLGIIDKVLLFENILNKHTAQELMTMVKTKNFPDGKPMSGLVWGFVVAWAADAKRGWSSGGITAIMMERKHGKTPDVIINKTEDNIDDETIDEEIKELEEKIRKEMTAKIRKEEREKILKEMEGKKE